MNMLFLAAGIAALDQVIKAFIRLNPVGATVLEIPGLFSLKHIVNTGAAFSLFSGMPVLLAILSLALLGAICFFVQKRMHPTKAASAALSFMLGGGVGNQIDRVFRGGVTDYIRLSFVDFPVFNLADMAITLSAAVLLVMLFTDTLEETSEEKHGSGH